MTIKLIALLVLFSGAALCAAILVWRQRQHRRLLNGRETAHLLRQAQYLQQLAQTILYCNIDPRIARVLLQLAEETLASVASAGQPEALDAIAGIRKLGQSIEDATRQSASANRSSTSPDRALASTNHSLASTNHSLASTNHSLISANHSLTSNQKAGRPAAADSPREEADDSRGDGDVSAAEYIAEMMIIREKFGAGEPDYARIRLHLTDAGRLLHRAYRKGFIDRNQHEQMTSRLQKSRLQTDIEHMLLRETEARSSGDLARARACLSQARARLDSQDLNVKMQALLAEIDRRLIELDQTVSGQGRCVTLDTTGSVLQRKNAHRRAGGGAATAKDA